MSTYIVYSRHQVSLKAYASVPKLIAALATALQKYQPQLNLRLIAPTGSEVEDVEVINLKKNVLLNKLLVKINRLFKKLKLGYSFKERIIEKELRRIVKAADPSDVFICFKDSDVKRIKRYNPLSKVIYSILSVYNFSPGKTNEDRLDLLLKDMERADLVVFNSLPVYRYLYETSLPTGIHVPMTHIPGIVKMHGMIEDRKRNFNRIEVLEKYNIPSSSRILLHIGGESRLKGKQVIEKALRSYVRPVGNITFISVGNHRTGEEVLYDGMIRILSLGFLSEEDLIDLLILTDIGLVPSLALEPGPTTTIEFLISGTYVLGSAIGGNLNNIKKGITGDLVDPPNSIDAWGVTITYWLNLLENQELKSIDPLETCEFYDESLLADRWLSAIKSVQGEALQKIN